jgi:hypothetical protein
MTKRKIIPIINGGLYAALAWWYEHLMPGHFEMSAYQKYRISKRKDIVNKRGDTRETYEDWKARHHKLSGPLRFRGELQRMVSSGYTVKAMTRKPTVKLLMHGPEYLRPAGRPARQPGGGMMPDMGGELTRVTSWETGNMCRMAVAKITTEMKRLKGRRKIASGEAV